MNYEMLAEIDDEIGDLHILDTANTVQFKSHNDTEYTIYTSFTIPSLIKGSK